MKWMAKKKYLKGLQYLKGILWNQWVLPFSGCDSNCSYRICAQPIRLALKVHAFEALEHLGVTVPLKLPHRSWYRSSPASICTDMDYYSVGTEFDRWDFSYISRLIVRIWLCHHQNVAKSIKYSCTVSDRLWPGTPFGSSKGVFGWNR